MFNAVAAALPFHFDGFNLKVNKPSIIPLLRQYHWESFLTESDDETIYHYLHVIKSKEFEKGELSQSDALVLQVYT